MHNIDTAANRVVAQIGGLLDLTRQRHIVRVEPGEAELVGTWDAVRLERMLTNLLSNAIKFSPDGGLVTVSVERDSDAASGDWAMLTVRDTGLGIPDNDLRRLFEHFQAGSNVADSIPGSGVGLASVLQIVERHGGTIGARSREGEGSVFTVRLALVARED
jgi:signal transduction histidine kinase